MKVEYEKMNMLLNKFNRFYEEQNYQKEDLTPYSVFGDFAIFFQEGVSNNSISQDEIEKAFCFFNELAESENNDVLNLLVVSVFEVFTDNSITIDLARQKLTDKGRKLFERTLRGWNNDI